MKIILMFFIGIISMFLGIYIVHKLFNTERANRISRKIKKFFKSII